MFFFLVQIAISSLLDRIRYSWIWKFKRILCFFSLPQDTVHQWINQNLTIVLIVIFSDCIFRLLGIYRGWSKRCDCYNYEENINPSTRVKNYDNSKFLRLRFWFRLIFLFDKIVIVRIVSCKSFSSFHHDYFSYSVIDLISSICICSMFCRFLLHIISSYVILGYYQ